MEQGFGTPVVTILIGILASRENRAGVARITGITTVANNF
jgi:hypothetical protein